MQNVILDKLTEKDIKKQVNKVLRDLGNPEPPFCVNDALRLLKLDRKYYSSTEDGIMQEVIHRIKVSGKQIIERPTLLIDVIKKADLQALWLPDSKRILIDKSLPKLKHRWSEGHEIAHSIIPWHKQFCLGDPAQTLRVNCREKIEAEANYASGQLLFLGDRFNNEANSYSINFETILKLADIYGNTITSTMYRFIEQAHTTTPMFGIICDHWFDDSCDFDYHNPCEHFILSNSFRSKFSSFNELTAFNIARSCCQKKRKRGYIGEGEYTVLDNNGDAHYFQIEIFSNSYKVLTLAVYKEPVTIMA